MQFCRGGGCYAMQDARLQVKLGAGLFVMHIWMMDVDKAVLKSSVRLATEPLTEGSNLIG